jgi:hypothetical protein
MPDPASGNLQGKRPASRLSPEKLEKLREEARAPYRGLRFFIYLTFGLSGFIGALIFLAQLIAGRDVGAAFPNFALQVGVVALMVWLARIDRSVAQKDRAKRHS